MLKGQDILLMTILLDGKNRSLPFSKLGERSHLSASEAHAAVRRLERASLLDHARNPIGRNVGEFLFYGFRYVFPPSVPGAPTKGLSTSYAAPVASGEFAFTGLPPVWASEKGDAYGISFSPLYPTVPLVAAENPFAYDCLALLEMLRGGRLREREFARRKLEALL